MGFYLNKVVIRFLLKMAFKFWIALLLTCLLAAINAEEEVVATEDPTPEQIEEAFEAALQDLVLHDEEAWAKIDKNKDGKLTLEDFEAATKELPAPHAPHFQLEDGALWYQLDLDGDGKLSVDEYEAFVNDAEARQYVKHIKAHRALEDWAKRLGIEPESAKAAMLMGAMAQRRSDFVNKLDTEKELATMRKAQLLEAARKKAAAKASNIQLNADIWTSTIQDDIDSRQEEL